MTHEELEMMPMGWLLDASYDARRQHSERVEAAEEILARLPTWHGNLLGLSDAQRVQLKRLVDASVTAREEHPARVNGRRPR